MNNATTDIIAQQNEKDKFSKLQHLQQVCLKNNIPFVSYRLPLEKDISTLVQQHSHPKTLESLNRLNKETGFVVSPFAQLGTAASSLQTHLLEPDSTFISNNIESNYINELSNNGRFLPAKNHEGSRDKSTTATEFIAHVHQTLKAIDEGALQKVVISKVRVEHLSHDFSASLFFLDLCRKYPHAMVYMLQLPQVGCWIGATPESLLEMDSEKVKTVSLAATQKATEQEINTYSWSSKEIEEQSIVTKSVEQSLRSLGVKNLIISGPTSYRAGNLVHLKTAFEFPLRELNNRVGEIILRLHPTPSVGGWPKDEALEFIVATENHKRAYYSGFLGPVNINTKSNIFVNLRCLQLFHQQALLYSGAGITASSVAEKEWEETENKMLTMMSVLKNSE